MRTFTRVTFPSDESHTIHAAEDPDYGPDTVCGIKPTEVWDLVTEGTYTCEICRRLMRSWWMIGLHSPTGDFRGHYIQTDTCRITGIIFEETGSGMFTRILIDWLDGTDKRDILFVPEEVLYDMLVDGNGQLVKREDDTL